MISFTPLFSSLILIGAGGFLASYVLHNTIYFVLTYNLFIILLAFLDYYISFPLLYISREYEKNFSMGEKNKVIIKLNNKSSYPFNVEIEDILPQHCRPSLAHFSSDIRSLETVSFEYYLTPYRRGKFDFGPIYIKYTGRLKLIRRRTILDTTDYIKVYPNLSEYKKFEVLIKVGRFSLTGTKPSKILGKGTTFDRLREYLPDDDFSQIYWKATARRAYPIIMEYDTEKSQNIILLLDAGRVMLSEIDGMSKLEYAIRTSLVLGIAGILCGDNIGAMAFSKDIHFYLPPTKGRGQLMKMMELFYSLNPSELESDYTNTFNYLMTRNLKRSLLILFSDTISQYSSNEMMKWLSIIYPKHLPIFVLLSDSEIIKSAQLLPETPKEFFQKAVGISLLEERKMVKAKLKERNVVVIETSPENLSQEVIKEYFKLKEHLYH